MIRTVLLSGLAALTLATGTAAAQDGGGTVVDPRMGAMVGMSMGMGMGMPPLMPRQPVFVNAAKRGAPPGALVTNPGVSRKAVHQEAITKVRGDAGFLAGFNKGQPLAASRQKPVEPFVPNFTFIDAPFIVNNLNSTLALTFGDNNVSGQGFPQEGGIPVEGGGAGHPAPHPTPAPATPPAGEIDPVLSNFGPLPHLPTALATGGVQFNNVGTAVNVASGQGNVALQQVTAVQKTGKR
ncbi:hypothetical protein [Azospirillum soli]|uniref:hypothetical protein n=1 Tax=Azospirillum soli TaxID=1304799 RepID=UPI001AE9A827|nr:hypothetical protein [Azospirillum soli]MBP2312535.1 hypothetical protein [Azospirillum soli]